jgi:predicted NAD/FAD-binding protein
MRIAIIGAGITGLSAARALLDRGHDVVVYEALDRVGGKVRTVTHSDRTYELGAYVTFKTDPTTMRWVDRFDVKLRESPPRTVIDLDQGGKVLEMSDWQKQTHGTFASLMALFRYWRCMRRNKGLYELGYHQADAKALGKRFDEFAKEHNFEALAYLFRHVHSGMGYGTYDQSAALYSMKFLDGSKLEILLKSMVGIKSTPWIVIGGFQTLWEHVAKDVDVRLSTPVQRVERTDSTVTVHAADGAETFDRLLVTAPGPSTLDWLDASDEERRLLQKVRYYPYATTLFRAEGLPRFESAYIGRHHTREHHNRTLLFSHPYKDGDHWLAWQYGSESEKGQMATFLREDVEATGGKFGEVVDQQFWPTYFPHVTPEDVGAGFYQDLEKLQGQRGTLWAGGLMNFELTGRTALWAEDLVRRFVPKGG